MDVDSFESFLRRWWVWVFTPFVVVLVSLALVSSEKLFGGNGGFGVLEIWLELMILMVLVPHALIAGIPGVGWGLLPQNGISLFIGHVLLWGGLIALAIMAKNFSRRTLFVWFTIFLMAMISVLHGFLSVPSIYP